MRIQMKNGASQGFWFAVVLRHELTGNGPAIKADLILADEELTQDSLAMGDLDCCHYLEPNGEETVDGLPDSDEPPDIMAMGWPLHLRANMELTFREDGAMLRIDVFEPSEERPGLPGPDGLSERPDVVIVRNRLDQDITIFLLEAKVQESGWPHSAPPPRLRVILITVPEPPADAYEAFDVISRTAIASGGEHSLDDWANVDGMEVHHHSHYCSVKEMRRVDMSQDAIILDVVEPN